MPTPARPRPPFRPAPRQQAGEVNPPDAGRREGGREAARRPAPPGPAASCRRPAVAPRPCGEMEAERLMVLYGDDSVEVRYAGGSRLLLSACGCEYLYEAAPPAAAHPLQPAAATRQRVAFALSAYRVRGGQALTGPAGRDAASAAVGGAGGGRGGECPGGRGGGLWRPRGASPQAGDGRQPGAGGESGTAVALCKTEGISSPLVQKRGGNRLKIVALRRKTRDMTGLCYSVLFFFALQ